VGVKKNKKMFQLTNLRYGLIFKFLAQVLAEISKERSKDLVKKKSEVVVKKNIKNFFN